MRALPIPIWLPIPSLCLWGLTVELGLIMCLLPEEFVRKHLPQEVPASPRQIGWQLVRLAWILLWSGSFTLCDVRVPQEGVRVRVRMY